MKPELARGVVEKSIADLDVGYLDLFVVVRLLLVESAKGRM